MFLTLVFVTVICTKVTAQQMRVVPFDTLAQLISRPSDTTYVVNFWATWCQPCLAELPAFVQLADSLRSEPVRVLLVSLDFVRDSAARVQPFITRRNLRLPVWLLNEPDANRWIDRVDEGWSGAIPATLLLGADRRQRRFLEQSLTYDALMQALTTLRQAPPADQRD